MMSDLKDFHSTARAFFRADRIKSVQVYFPAHEFTKVFEKWQRKTTKIIILLVIFDLQIWKIRARF